MGGIDSVVLCIGFIGSTDLMDYYLYNLLLEKFTRLFVYVIRVFPIPNPLAPILQAYSSSNLILLP